MVMTRWPSSLVLIFVFATAALALSAHGQDASSTPEAGEALDKFNQQFVGACQKMDNAATAALWAENGTDLLPGMEPLEGKAQITEWLAGLTKTLEGAKVERCAVEWHDLQIQGDLAYEWGITAQKVVFPAPKPPAESVGKIVLVLRRQQDRTWKIVLESWNGMPEVEKKP